MSAPLSRRQARAGLWFTLPSVLLILVFFFGPVLYGLWLSLTDFDLYAIGDPSTARFVGLGNYSGALTNPEFWNALKVTLWYALVGAPVSVAVSLAAALLVDAHTTRFKPFFRAVYFAPVVTTLVAVAIVWRYLYQPQYGIVNALLRPFGVPTIDWLGDPHWALFSILVLAVWKNFGYNLLIFVAGLQGVPRELHEAAELDGANGWQRFWNVTLPELAPVFLFVSVTTMINYFQLFAEPYVMTQGGPLKSTTSLVLLMYEQGFRWWRLGYAAALAFLLFAVILVATTVQMRLQSARERT
ncbi:MAG TPA: sugar ABC transporter permease [Candidatus Eisenbacteria bacterium]